MRTNPLTFTSGPQLARQLAQAHTLNADVHARAKSRDGTARGKWRLRDRSLAENTQRLNSAVAAIAKDQKIDWPTTYKLHIDGPGYSESVWIKVTT